MSKEIYIAGKAGSGEETIPELASELEKRGHKITLKWWVGESLSKPYLNYPNTSSRAAEEMIRAIIESDVFILIPSEGVLGALVEFGVAIRGKQDNQEKEVIVINPHKSRQSVFYAHPDVVVLNNIGEIRNRPWY